jgi:ribosomal protein L17
MLVTKRSRLRKNIESILTRRHLTRSVSRRFFKILYSILIFLISIFSYGQDTNALKKSIDIEVERIDNDKRLSSTSFSIEAMKKVLHYISYNYVESKSGYIRISRQYYHKNDSISQTFYLNGGQLIYATEMIVTYYNENDKTDHITWGGSFYFSKGKLIDYITLGHGKSELENWKPDRYMLMAFDESKKDIARYKKKKNGG